MKRLVFFASVLLVLLGLYRCGVFVGKPDIQLNPHPKMRYDITLTIDGAPGPFDAVDGFIQFEVTNDECVPVTGAPMNPLRLAPKLSPAVVFTRVSGNVYTATVYADYLLDEDYYGLGVCHWSLISVGSRLKINNSTLFSSLPREKFFAQEPVSTYFVAAHYLDSAAEASSFGYPSPSSYRPELQKQVFSITLIAKEQL